MYDKLNFSYNWNNKLDCNVFTTLRLKSERYKVGNKFRLFLKEDHKKDVEIIAVKHFPLSNITDYIAGLDTGYTAPERQALIKKMYTNKNIDWSSQQLAFVLFKTIKR